jgi:hypothetical protein
MAYASSSLMLAFDRWMFDIHWRNVFREEPLIQQLRPRQCNQPSASALAKRRTNFVPATKTTLLSSLTRQRQSGTRTGSRRITIRQRPQQTRTQPATTLSNWRRPRYRDIRNFLYRATASGTTMHETQTATEEMIAPTNYLISRCRAIRNRIQPPRSRAIQTPRKNRPIHSTTSSPECVPYEPDSTNHEPRRHKQPRKNRPLPQPVPSLIYAHYATVFKQHEPRRARLQPTRRRYSTPF